MIAANFRGQIGEVLGSVLGGFRRSVSRADDTEPTSATHVQAGTIERVQVLHAVVHSR